MFTFLFFLLYLGHEFQKQFDLLLQSLNMGQEVDLASLELPMPPPIPQLSLGHVTFEMVKSLATHLRSAPSFPGLPAMRHMPPQMPYPQSSSSAYFGVVDYPNPIQVQPQRSPAPLPSLLGLPFMMPPPYLNPPLPGNQSAGNFF